MIRRKLGRYDLEGENEDLKARESISISTKKKTSSLYEDASLSFTNQTLHVRPYDRYHNRKLKGKLIIGRPPSTLIV